MALTRWHLNKTSSDWFEVHVWTQKYPGECWVFRDTYNQFPFTHAFTQTDEQAVEFVLMFSSHIVSKVDLGVNLGEQIGSIPNPFV